MADEEKKYDIWAQPAWELAWQAAYEKRLDVLALAAGMLAGEVFAMQRALEDIKIVVSGEGDAAKGCSNAFDIAEGALAKLNPAARNRS